MYQILQGLKCLHLLRFVHRDLKPDNLLVNTSTGTLKLCDFGLAKPVQIPGITMTTGVQTLWYRAPELILSDHLYSFGVDVWAAGCIFFELLTGRIMFQSTSEIGLLFKIFELLGTPSPETWNGLAGLPNYSPKFPKYRPKEFESAFPDIEDKLALDLLSKMICLNPAKRICVLDCLQHPYFSGMDTLHYN